MRPNREQKRAFGARLRAARIEAGWSTVQQFADHLRDHELVASPSTAKLSAWERGEYAPSDRSIIEALEAAVGLDGELVALLGAELPDEDELTRIWREINDLKTRVVELEGGGEVRHLRAAASKRAKDPGAKPGRRVSRPRAKGDDDG